LPNLWGILPNHQAHTEASHVRSTCADSASREHLPRPPNTPPPTCNTRCVLTSWSPGTIDGANRNYVERTYWRAKSPNVKFNRSRVFAKRVRQELVAASHLLRGGYKWRCRGARSTTGGTTRTADGSCMATEGWAASAGGSSARIWKSAPLPISLLDGSYRLGETSCTRSQNDRLSVALCAECFFTCTKVAFAR
jgi:hypothetical protein